MYLVEAFSQIFFFFMTPPPATYKKLILSEWILRVFILSTASCNGLMCQCQISDLENLHFTIKICYK